MQNWNEIRRIAWNYLGISRSDERLLKAEKRIALIEDEIGQYFWNSPLTVDRIEVRNIAFITEMIVRSARMRKESRRLHFNTDYPFALPEAKDTVINIKSKSAGE